MLPEKILPKAGSTTSITLDASASSIDGHYNNCILQIISGTGIEQVSIITAYNGTTKVATAIFKIAPDSTSQFIIHIISGVCPPQNLSNPYKKVLLCDTDITSMYDDIYNQCFIRFFHADGTSQFNKIIGYDSTTNVADILDDLDKYIDEDTCYVIYGISGVTSTASLTSITLQDNYGHSSDDDYYSGYIIEIYDGGAFGETNYQFVDKTRSSMVYDTNNTLVPSNSTLIISKIISGDSSASFDIDKLNLLLHKNETMTITMTRNTNTNIELIMSTTWQEDR
mgnify:CR=1 FL=1